MTLVDVWASLLESLHGVKCYFAGEKQPLICGPIADAYDAHEDRPRFALLASFLV